MACHFFWWLESLLMAQSLKMGEEPFQGAFSPHFVPINSIWNIYTMSFNLRTCCEQQERHFCCYIKPGQISFRMFRTILYTVTRRSHSNQSRYWEELVGWSAVEWSYYKRAWLVLKYKPERKQKKGSIIALECSRKANYRDREKL